MNGRTQQGLFRDESGSTGLIMALLLVVLAAVTALAVDLSLLHVRRSSLQTSADAAALAGANALMSYGGDLDRTRGVILDYARRNLDSQDQPAVAVEASDIVFYRDGVASTTSPNQVEVTVRRAQARGNAVDLLFGRAVDAAQKDLSAKARAGFVNADSSKCLRPWSVAARFTWNDRADAQNSGYYNNGVYDVASAAETASVVVTGYSAADIGAQIILKFGDPHDTIVPGQYNPVDYPPLNKGNPVTGGSAYAENIAACTGSNVVVVESGDQLQTEPGDKVGPTRQGVAELVSQDPGAYWDTATGSIKGSSAKDPLLSPRVVIIPFYDPRNPPTSGRDYVTVSQLGAVFVEGIDNKGNVTGRFLKTVPFSPRSGGSGNGMLAIARLIEDSSRGAAQ